MHIDDTTALYMVQMPFKFQPHISQIINVTGDGYFGFRAIAALLDHGEHRWHDIRNIMIAEMNVRANKYVDMWGVELFNSAMNALIVTPTQVITEDYWLSIPDMEYVISTAFNIVLITIAISGCATFLSLAGPPPLIHRVIAIGHGDKNHWVQVKL